MLKTILFILMLAAAAVDWWAVGKNKRKIEYLAKPATIILLFTWLAVAGGFEEIPLVCFGLGLILSLVGDVFLVISYARFSNRWFIPGLVAFLLVHLAYIVGLNLPPAGASPVWSIGIGLILALTAGRVLRRIVAAVRAKGLRRMVAPVVAYGMVITLMLLSAILTLYRSDWKLSAAGLVSLGAGLFYLSDLLLAWNKFIRPVRNGRVMNMVTYHLGQIALVAGVIIQFGK